MEDLSLYFQVFGTIALFLLLAFIIIVVVPVAIWSFIEVFFLKR